jgi:hypothetical protein
VYNTSKVNNQQKTSTTSEKVVALVAIVSLFFDFALLGVTIYENDRIVTLQANQNTLQTQIFNITNPSPNATILSVETISIGPPPSSEISVSTVGASFQFDGNLSLNFTVLLFTAHQGELTIPANSLTFVPTYNTSNYRIGFHFVGITFPRYLVANVTMQLLPISLQFEMNYVFTDSNILRYPVFPFGYITFPLTLTDPFTHLTSSQTGQAPLQWNNSTAMP